PLPKVQYLSTSSKHRDWNPGCLKQGSNWEWKCEGTECRGLTRLKTKLISALCVAVFMCLGAGCAFAMNAELRNASAISTNAVEPAGSATAIPAEHGPSQKAVEIARPFGFPVTNSMVATWIVALGLIVFAQVATRRMKPVPEGAQNFWEWLVEGLYTFLEGIIGSHLVGRTFWFFSSIFIFILFANWVSLIPGVGTIGWGHQSAHGFEIDQPLFRGANADVNLTLAMALIFFACWIIWALREDGLVGFLKELFAPKGDTAGLLKVIMVVVFFASG